MSQYKLEQLMRWYGPSDPVRLQDIRQAGCSGVVSALHAIPVGEIWEEDTINKYKSNIEEHGLTWTVVESLPVHEDIKIGLSSREKYIHQYKESLKNLAACGIKVVTYNFMPVLDWLRTDVAYKLPNGGEALKFNKKEYQMVDLFMLKRPGVEDDYTKEEQETLKIGFDELSEERKKYLFKNILLGLPGSDIPFTRDEVLGLLEKYREVDRIKLKENLFYFLNEITPVAEEVGIQMAIHPDDPPFSVMGLPRIMSTAYDIEELIGAVPNPANGLCFCTGSYGARPDNDIIAMIRKWGDRIYFFHLRNTKRDPEGNFMEDNHLDGDTDMYAVMTEAVKLMHREQRSIPMRPDHGHKLMDDLAKITYPGYSGIGRVKGLAELRGLEYAIQRTNLDE